MNSLPPLSRLVTHQSDATRRRGLIALCWWPVLISGLIFHSPASPWACLLCGYRCHPKICAAQRLVLCCASACAFTNKASVWAQLPDRALRFRRRYSIRLHESCMPYPHQLPDFPCMCLHASLALFPLLLPGKGFRPLFHALLSPRGFMTRFPKRTLASPNPTQRRSDHLLTGNSLTFSPSATPEIFVTAST